MEVFIRGKAYLKAHQKKNLRRCHLTFLGRAPDSRPSPAPPRGPGPDSIVQPGRPGGFGSAGHRRREHRATKQNQKAGRAAARRVVATSKLSWLLGPRWKPCLQSQELQHAEGDAPDLGRNQQNSAPRSHRQGSTNAL